MRYVILTILLLMAKPALAECMLDTCINSIRGPDNAITVSPTLSHDIKKDPRVQTLAEDCIDQLNEGRSKDARPTAKLTFCREHADWFVLFWDKMKEIEAKNKPAPVRDTQTYVCVKLNGHLGYAMLGKECK